MCACHTLFPVWKKKIEGRKNVGRKNTGRKGSKKENEPGKKIMDKRMKQKRTKHRTIGDLICKITVYIAATLVVAWMGMMLLHIGKESLPAFRDLGVQMLQPDTQWRPVSTSPKFGLLPAITGTLYVSAVAVAAALVLGLGFACALQLYAPKKVAAVFLAWMDLTAGIPSVIFGLVGLTVVVKWFASHLHMAAGQCVLAAGIVLAVMLLPFFVSTCYESLQTARETYEQTALALGFSKEMTLVRVLLPAIRQGILASVMMAFGRALGETMAVMMVIGNSPIYPRLLGRGQTIAGLTALEMGSVEYGSLHLSVLYAANVILLVILLIVMETGYLLKRRIRTDEN